MSGSGSGGHSAPPPTTLDWDAAVAALTAGGSPVALLAHVDPDGDALGSMLALGLALVDRGTPVVASFDAEPFRVPRSLAFLPGLELISPPEQFPDHPRLVVTFDVGSWDRLGRLETAARVAETLIVVDHHASNTGFGDLHLVDPGSAATAVLVEQLLARMGVPLSAAVATALYTGLVTDTGSFRYASVTPAVHTLAARLVAAGASPERVGREVFGTHRLAYLQLLGGMLARLALDEGRSLAWTWVDAAELAGVGVALEEVEGAIDVVRTTAEAEVSAVCKQAPDGSWRVSTRSRGDTDVARVCTALGGGGHRYAAGFSWTGPLTGALAALGAALDAERALSANAAASGPR